MATRKREVSPSWLVPRERKKRVKKKNRHIFSSLSGHLAFFDFQTVLP
jgi:hypothetical protein